MNDTETRLRDYLQATAATVPDNAPGLDLETDGPAHRRRWPVILAAAAIAAVLVLAASFLTRLSPTQPDPAGPPGPVSGEAPRIPYTVTENRVTTLHDGEQQVRVKFRSDGYFRGRVGGGWLALEMPENRITQAGILLPNGSFRPIGPPRGTGPVPSPDGSKVVLVARRADQKGRLVVIDVRTGRELASTPVQARVPLVMGWNKAGIWMRHDETNKPQLLVWQPGSGQPQPVSAPAFDGALAVPGAADNVVLSTRAGQNRCLKAGMLRGTNVEVQREYCDQGVAQLYPVLSPDGRTMIHSLQKVAIDVGTGKVTKLQLPDQMLDWPEPVFEDATHLLALTQPEDGIGQIPRELYRCDVATGACTLLVKDAANITLQQP
ncbi:hypothetical protein AB0F43_04645 [Kribbella sp. NPDC023972]|uniref:hypothetical protein n=1 Tax=Kribbella sp. NPDC023972 TaxID=3154795 RepID=UPI0033C60B7C